MSEWITKFRRRGQSVQKFHSSETINCFALANTANTPVKMINKRDERTKGLTFNCFWAIKNFQLTLMTK